MKKIVLPTLLLILFSSGAHAQNDPSGLQQVIPPPPSITEMEKYTNYDVGLENGVASFSIPIYTIKIGKIVYPITLSYHASGIKYHQSANDVGAGWMLTPLYEVSRTVNCWPDENVAMPADLDLNDLGPLTTYAREQWLSSFYYKGSVDSDIPPPANGPQDGEYDYFNYNIGGDAGSFIISDRVNQQISLTSKNPTRISYQQDNVSGLPPGIKYFNVTDANGIVYEMGKTAGSNESLFSVSNYSSVLSAITAWYTSKITDPFGNSIKLNYVDHSEEEDDTYEKTLYARDFTFINGITVDEGKITLGTGHIGGFQAKQISSIATVNETVNFYRRQGAEGGVIDSIVVVDAHNVPVKRVFFHYTTSGVHYLLDGLTFIGNDNSQEKYGFQYYPDPTGGLNRDFWGYYSNNNFTDNNFPSFDNIVAESSGVDGPFTPIMVPVSEIVPTLYMGNFGFTPNCYSLQRITFPTGGYREFEYEPNQYTGYDELSKTNTTKYMGMRIKRIKSNDGFNANNTLIRDYKYGTNESGQFMLYDDMARNYWFEKDIVALGMPGSTMYSAHSTFYTSRNPFLSAFDMANEVYYPQVTVYETRDENIFPIVYNGKTEYYFGKTTPPAAYLQNFPNGATTDYYAPFVSIWDKPLTKEIKYYTGTGTNTGFTLLKDETYQYTLHDAHDFKSLRVNKAASALNGFAGGADANYYSATNSFFNYGNYTVSCAAPVLTQKSVKTFDPGTGAASTTTYNYGYNSLNQQSSSTSDNSKGEKITVVSQYPVDYTISGTVTNNDALGIQKLQAANVLSPIVEEITSRVNTDGSNNRVVSSVFTTFRPDIPAPITIFKTELNTPIQNFTPTAVNPSGTVMNAGYQPKIQFDAYDNTGNIIQQHKMADLPMSYIWDYNKTHLIAGVTNAGQSDIAFTSFEADGAGNWTITPSSVIATAGITGTHSYTLSNNLSRPGLTSGTTYIVSYWSTNASTSYSIPGTLSGYPIKGKTVTIGGTSWTYYEHKISGQTTININGTGGIDEVRMYPTTALMTSYTYLPLIGMTSSCDPAGRISYYEYDGLGRLRDVRDQDGNIIKTYEYHYKGQ